MRNKAFFRKKTMLALISGNDSNHYANNNICNSSYKHVILEAIMFQTQEIHLARVAQQNVFKMLATH